MLYISYFLSIWLLCGFIAGLLKICSKDFNEVHRQAVANGNVGNPKNPKLFSLAVASIFGIYSLYAQITVILHKRKYR